MIRLLLFVTLAAAAVIAVLFALRMLRESRVDWPGVAFIAGFVLFAFYMRDVTGIGWF
jgi:uncharacterized membrane protein YgdD (TMEM256/DUF423 family)